MNNPWIQTYTGKRFHILDPCPEEICIEDIAHALAQQCRFTGHTRQFYSVAEHSYWVSILVPEGVELAGLLHDASEAYLADLNSPTKNCTNIGPPYRILEAQIIRAVEQRFCFRHAGYHDADRAMLFTERAQLMTPLEWEETGTLANIKLRCWTPVEAEGHFLRRYYELVEAK